MIANRFTVAFLATTAASLESRWRPLDDIMVQLTIKCGLTSSSTHSFWDPDTTDYLLPYLEVAMKISSDEELSTGAAVGFLSGRFCSYISVDYLIRTVYQAYVLKHFLPPTVLPFALVPAIVDRRTDLESELERLEDRVQAPDDVARRREWLNTLLAEFHKYKEMKTPLSQHEQRVVDFFRFGKPKVSPTGLRRTALSVKETVFLAKRLGDIVTATVDAFDNHLGPSEGDSRALWNIITQIKNRYHANHLWDVLYMVIENTILPMIESMDDTPERFESLSILLFLLSDPTQEQFESQQLDDDETNRHEDFVTNLLDD